MADTILKGVVSNGLANVFQKSVRILDQLFLVPFFLLYWGTSYYGEWLTLSIIPSILAFSDLGFGSAVCNGFVLAYAAGDKQKAADLNRSGYLVISFSVLVGVVAATGLLLLGRSLDFFAKSEIVAEDAILAVVLMIAARLIGFYTQLIEGYFRGARKAAYGSFLGTCSNILNIVAGLAVLYWGGRVVAFAFSQFVISVLFVLLYAYIGFRQIDLNGYKGRVLRSDLRMIVLKGMGYLMTPVWQSIYFQGSTFVVRVVLGAEPVAMFNTVRTVCRSVNQVFSVINGSIFPDLQYEYGRGNMPLVHRLFRISVFVSMVTGIAGVGILCLFGQSLYQVWTNGMLDVPGAVWTVFMSGALCNAIWWTSVVTYRMTNQPYHFAVMSTVMSVLSVGLSYFLGKRYGLQGVAFGTLLFEFVMMCYVLPDSCHLLGMKVRDLFVHIPEDMRFLKARFAPVVRRRLNKR